MSALWEAIYLIRKQDQKAKIVRRIYKEYLDGAAISQIAKGLERDKAMTGGKRFRWHKSTVEGILKNEKYIGDALLQKTITTDFIEKTRIDNDGSVPQYYVTDDHEPIIPRDVFAEVQEEMLRRNNIYIEYDDLMVRKYIKEINVFDDRFHFSFKAGVEVDVPRQQGN